jgi:hypothetical protein
MPSASAKTETSPKRGEARTKAVLRDAVAATEGIAGLLVVGLLAAAPRDPELAAVLAQQFHYEQLPRLLELLERARERHEVSPDVDPSIITEILPGALIMHVLVLGLPGDEAFLRRLLDEVLVPLLTG